MKIPQLNKTTETKTKTSTNHKLVFLSNLMILILVNKSTQ